MRTNRPAQTAHSVLQTARERPCRAFTLIELLVVISVIIILASLAMPTITGSLKTSVDTNCVSNLRQIGSAFMTYVNEYQGFMPASGSPGSAPPNRFPKWYHNLEPFIRVKEGTRNIFACPAKETAIYGYGLNHMWCGPSHIYGNGTAMWNFSKEISSVRNPTGTIIIADCGYLANNTDGGGDNYADTDIPVSAWRETPQDNVNGCTRYPYDNVLGTPGDFIYWHTDPRRPFPRHGADSTKTNFLFFDSHVRPIETTDVVDDLWGEPGCLYDNEGVPAPTFEPRELP
jgi:prepilin-type N-terminal cleavage/methylation domain-containing protein/prepilin-type processing-associated H-X9-DG protein